MKYKIVLIPLLIVSLLFAFGCKQKHHRKRPTKETVHSYRTHSSSSDNEWIYWYLIYDSNTRMYYSASSSSRVSSYSSLNWSKSSEKPTELDKEAEDLGQEEVSQDELGEAAEAIESDYDSLDSMEGVTDGDMSIDSDSSSSDSDSGSSDSSSGDSSGGDSGGGDGGGSGGC